MHGFAQANGYVGKSDQPLGGVSTAEPGPTCNSGVSKSTKVVQVQFTFLARYVRWQSSESGGLLIWEI